MSDLYIETQVNRFLDELMRLTITRPSSLDPSKTIEFSVIHDDARHEVSHRIRKYLTEVHTDYSKALDVRTAQLEAKVLFYEEVIKKSTFAPFIAPEKL